MPASMGSSMLSLCGGQNMLRGALACGISFSHPLQSSDLLHTLLTGEWDNISLVANLVIYSCFASLINKNMDCGFFRGDHGRGSRGAAAGGLVVA